MLYVDNRFLHHAINKTQRVIYSTNICALIYLQVARKWQFDDINVKSIPTLAKVLVLYRYFIRAKVTYIFVYCISMMILFSLIPKQINDYTNFSHNICSKHVYTIYIIDFYHLNSSNHEQSLSDTWSRAVCVYAYASP